MKKIKVYSKHHATVYVENIAFKKETTEILSEKGAATLKRLYPKSFEFLGEVIEVTTAPQDINAGSLEDQNAEIALDKMTKNQLIEKAASLEIEAGEMTKAQLIEAIEAKLAEVK